jgi:membrane-bound metal-dependent hydrolase YbcI (DUF457 family)
MDPISHATFGVAVVEALGTRVETRGDTRTIVRGATMATVLGALSPDIDAIVMPFGWDRYLLVHRIGTHAIVGTIACGLLTAGVVWLFVRSGTTQQWRDLGRRGYWTLAVCAWIGAVSHVLLDLLSSARLEPGWPFINTIVSWPVVAMADPWMLGLCVLAAVAVRFAGRPRNAAVLTLLLIAMFVSIKAMLGFVAISRYEVASASIDAPVLSRVVEAEWGRLSRWRVADATRTQLRTWTTSATQSPRVELSWTRAPESDLTTASRRFSTVANFLSVHALTFSVVVPGTFAEEAARDDGGTRAVLWSDIRFCWDAGTPGAPQLRPIVSAPGQMRIACALWFGGEIGTDGQLGMEIVRIGGLTQTRRSSVR